MAHLSGDASLLARVRRAARTSTAPPPRRSSARARDEVTARAAPLRQGDQLRPDLRHERLRPRAAARHRARHRRRPTSTATSRAIPASRSTWSARGSRRASRATSRRCSAAGCGCRTSAAPTPRAAQGAERAGDQRADAGHGGRPHQAGDDRGAGLARHARSSRRSSSCRCTTNWCSRCPRASSRRVQSRAAEADDRRGRAEGAAGGGGGRGAELGAGALNAPRLPTSASRTPSTPSPSRPRRGPCGSRVPAPP